MERIGLRDLTGQRRAEVAVSDGNATVGDVLAQAVQAMGLPQQTQRGLDLDYQIRASDGSLLRPSESLADESVLQRLTDGEATAIPRLTAA